MGIWITRPKQDASQLRELVEALGLKAVVSPLLDVAYIKPEENDLSDVRAIIVTSRNGLRGLCYWLDGPEGHFAAGLENYKTLPLYVVGEGSAELARQFGFTDIKVGAGNAQSLVPLILAGGYDQADELLHIRGNKVAFDLKGAIEAEGLTLCEAETYHIVEAHTLSSEVLTLLQTNGLDAVILMSPRTAIVYGNLMKAAHQKAAMDGLVHLCFSEQVREALDPYGVQQVRVMEQTELSQIIDCLKTLYLT